MSRKDNHPIQHPFQVGACYNTRIQKGGALLEEMRVLVRFWRSAPVKDMIDSVVRENILNKTTRARAADILRRTFVPRFVEGPIANAWTLLRPLEEFGASTQVVRPIYYWLTAKSEPMIADFVSQVVWPRATHGRVTIHQLDVLNWLNNVGCRWSPTVSTKVARGLLAALRDFGVLEGRALKSIASVRLPINSFAYISFCLHRLGVAARKLVDHTDWQLFLLRPSDVEHYFLEAHQRRLLQYHAAGSIVSLAFPVGCLEEYARVVVEQPN